MMIEKTEGKMNRAIKISHDTSTVTSLLLPEDLTNEQVCKIIIALAKTVIEENGGNDIMFKKEERK